MNATKEALHNSGIILTDYRTMISGKLPSTYGELKDDGEYERVYQTVSEKGDSLLKAYAESYDEIIKGHSEGSRETYIADESSENGFRKQTADEELSELDKAYEDMASMYKITVDKVRLDGDYLQMHCICTGEEDYWIDSCIIYTEDLISIFEFMLDS